MQSGQAQFGKKKCLPGAVGRLGNFVLAHYIIFVSGYKRNETEHSDGELTDWSTFLRNWPGGNSMTSLRAGGAGMTKLQSINCARRG